MKLKNIFYEYEMPDYFWDKLEKIFEIETKEAYEKGLKDSQETKPLNNSDTCEKVKNYSVKLQNDSSPDIKDLIDKDYSQKGRSEA